MRFDWINRCLNWRRRDIFRLIRVTAGMQDLHGNFPASLMHGLSNDFMLFSFFNRVELGTALKSDAMIIR